MSNGHLSGKFWIPILVMVALSVASIIYGGVAMGAEKRLAPRVTGNERDIVGLKTVDAYRNAEIESMQEDLRELKTDVKQILIEVRK